VKIVRAIAAVLVAVPFVVAALLAGCSGHGSGSRTADVASEHATPTLEEGKKLAAQRGVPVLVDFWAST
jgi:hypothetical protein